MSHPRDDGSMDAHTFIHEFGHMLGLKDYYDPNSYIELSPVSPLGRMDMMDCSLGDHNAFSKCILGWEAPMVVNGEAEIALRPSQGNGDCVLLPLSTSNGTLFDEYLLLEYYSPTYLNYADASLRGEMGMTLMGKTGIKAYHVDARIGLYDNRSKAPKAYLTPNVNVGTHSLDFYCENSGTSSRGTAYSSRGFLIQSINVSSSSLALPENFIASDHDEDIPYGNTVARLRNVLFQVGQGINANTKDMTFHTGGALRYGFEVTAVTPGYAKIRTFSL